MKVSKSEIVAVFELWSKDFAENPETFEKVSDTLTYHPEYSENCADYFIQCLKTVRGG